MAMKIAQMMFDKAGVPQLKKYLDLSSENHKIISGNISNTATPGYKSRSMDFFAELKKATQPGSRLQGTKTHSGHISLGSHKDAPPKIEEQKLKSGELNSVDIDKEVPALATNEMVYSVGAKLIQKRFEGLRKAIQSK